MSGHDAGRDQYRRAATATNRHPVFVRKFAELARVFPVASQHRAALHELGSEVTDARKWDGPGDRGVWTVLIRFGAVIEKSLNLNREVMLLYTNDIDFQVRDYARLRKYLDRQPRKVQKNICFVYSKDILQEQKLRDWTAGEPLGVATLRLHAAAADSADEIVSNLTTLVAQQNLYEERLPVTGDDFFGRELLLKELADNLRMGKVCGIFGLRKTGKTSLVKELGRRFESTSNDRIFILRDLEDLPSDPSKHGQALYMDLVASMLPRLRERGLRTHELAHLTVDSGISEFRRALQATLGHVASKDIQMVVALDEIESLIGPDFESSTERPHIPEFLGVLRSVVQENSNFNVVISGLTDAVLNAGTLYGRENPLFAWAPPHYVPPLDANEAADLVTTIGGRMALEWSNETLERVFRISEGHVFLHRTFCAKVVDGLPRDLSERTITMERLEWVERAWRRSVAEQVQQMLMSLERFYATAFDVLEIIAAQMAPLSDVESAYPSEMEQLLRLGLLRETRDDLVLTAFAHLALRK